MKKLLKIFIWFILILIVLLAGLFVTSKLLEDKIVNKSVTVINEQLNLPVKVKNIEFSLLKQFPNASLQLNNVLILSDERFYTKHFDQSYADTLIYFEELYLSVNILALLNNKLDITKAYGKHGQLNFLVDRKGNENFKVFKQKTIKESTDSNKNELVFMLNQIQLKQVKVRFINKYKSTGLVLFAPNYEVKGKFYKKNYSASSKGKLLLHSFEQGKLKIQPSTPASVLANLAINNNSIKIESGYIQTNAYKVSTTGLVRLSNPIFLDLNLSASTNKLDQLIKDANVKIKNQFNARGNFGVSAIIKGEISNTASPVIAANFKLENGAYSNEKYGELSEINISGSFSNGSKRSSETSSIAFETFEIHKGSSKIKGEVKLSNFNNPFMESSVETAINLDDLQSFNTNNSSLTYSGKITGEVAVSGFLNMDNSWKVNLKEVDKEGQLSIQNAGLIIKKPEFNIGNFSSNVKFDNAWLTFENITSTVQSTTVKGKVSVIGYINSIVDSTYPIKVKSNLIADNIRYADFENLFSSNGDENTREYNIYCDFKSNQAEYQNLKFNSARGNLHYVANSLYVSDLEFKTQDGEVTGDFKYSSISNKSYSIQTHTKTSNINIRSLFEAFRNFNQDHLKAENINGKLNSDFELEMVFVNDKLDTSSIDMLGHLRIDNGELINFKPITEAARFSDIDDLKQIKFSKLENNILITNSTIYIPSMDLTSNAFDMQVHGHQKFNGDYKYHLKINMSDFLGGKSKRLSKQQSEFGYVEDDGRGKKTLFLVASSINDESKVKLDRAAIRANFKHKRIEEKQEFKQILRDEFGLFKKDTTLKKKAAKEDEPEFIIEWDEE